MASDVYLNTSSLSVLRALRGTQRAMVADFIDSLSRNPDHPGDYEEIDLVGRPVRVKVLGKYALINWHDTPVNEVNITGIVAAHS